MTGTVTESDAESQCVGVEMSILKNIIANIVKSLLYYDQSDWFQVPGSGFKV
jgi:hypothetical protein